MNTDEERRKRWIAYCRRQDGEYDRRDPFPEDLIDLRCGAKNRAGKPCGQRALYSNGRCKFHGGLATGPKTEAGRAQSRINGLRGGRPRKDATVETGVMDTQEIHKDFGEEAPDAPSVVAVAEQAECASGKPKSCTSLCARCSMLASNGRCLALAKGVIQSMSTSDTCAGFDDFENPTQRG